MLSRIDNFVDQHRVEIYQVLMIGLLSLWVNSFVQAVPATRTDEDHRVWRMTRDGWELAHALQSPVHDGTVMEFPMRIETLPVSSLAVRIHRCLLPVAIAALFATLLPWLLLYLPNRAIRPVGAGS